jgi:hypothetical protein
VAAAARLIDGEIDKATAAGPVPQYYLGLAAEVLLAAGRPADGLAHLDRAIATVDEPGVSFYLPEIYRRAANASSRSAVTTRKRRGRPSWWPATSPNGRVRRFWNAAPKRPWQRRQTAAAFDGLDGRRFRNIRRSSIGSRKLHR